MSLTEWISLILMVLGEACVLLALLGVLRLKYVLNRMHATTIADTLGTLLMLLGVMLQFGLSWVTLKLLLVLLFQWVTVPVSGHMIARMVCSSRERDVSHHAEITYTMEEEE
jgi:multicomponent Na+:H+ antiporter subunit G